MRNPVLSILNAMRHLENEANMDNVNVIEAHDILEDLYASLIWEHENDPDRNPNPLCKCGYRLYQHGTKRKCPVTCDSGGRCDYTFEPL